MLWILGLQFKETEKLNGGKNNSPPHLPMSYQDSWDIETEFCW